MPSINLKKGRQVEFGYARETTRLTGANTPLIYIPITDVTLTPKVEKIEDNSGIANLEPLINTHKRLESVEGSWGGFVYADQIGYYLKHIYGNSTSVQTAATGAYTHDFSLANTVSNGTFSLFYNIEAWRRASGCQLKTLKIDAAEGGEVKYTCEFLGIEETGVATQTYIVPNVSNLLTSSNMICKITTANNIAGLAGADEFKIMNLSISLDRGTTYDMSYNNGKPNDVLQNGAVTEVTATLMMRQDDFLTWFQAKTNRTISFKFGGQNLPNIGTSSLKPSLEFICPNVSIFDYVRSVSLDEYMMFDITFKPEFSTTSGFSTTTKLINGVTTY